MAYLLGNEVACRGNSCTDLKKKWRSMLSKDKVVEFLTKTDRKEGRNTQIHIAR